MICQFCKDEGKTSRLYIGAGSSTTVAFAPFYDEKGAWHAHDPNTHSVEYSCSNGHQFKTEQRRRCPSCDFGQ